MRVAVGRNAAYDLYLTRTLKHAQVIRAPSPSAAVELFLADKLEAVAGVRQPLLAAAKGNPSLRVMEGRFMAIEQAMGMPKGRDAGARYLCGFVRGDEGVRFCCRCSAAERSRRCDRRAAVTTSVVL